MITSAETHKGIGKIDFVADLEISQEIKDGIRDGILKCKVCSATLTDDNWWESRQKRQDLICKSCFYEYMNWGGKKRPDNSVDREYYKIHSYSKKPFVRAKKRVKKNKIYAGTLKDMFLDTEQYRSSELYNIIANTDILEVKVDAIQTLLKGNPQLTLRESIGLVNTINGIIADSNTPLDTKLTLIRAAKSFAGGRVEPRKTKMFEELISGDGTIEVESP